MASGAAQVGGIVGYYYSGTVISCYNTGAVGGTGDMVGGIAGENDGTLSYNYYTAYLGVVGQSGSTAAVDVENGTIPFVSCVNPGVGESKTIKELAATDLNAEFKSHSASRPFSIRMSMNRRIQAFLLSAAEP